MAYLVRVYCYCLHHIRDIRIALVRICITWHSRRKRVVHYWVALDFWLCCTYARSRHAWIGIGFTQMWAYVSKIGSCFLDIQFVALFFFLEISKEISFCWSNYLCKMIKSYWILISFKHWTNFFVRILNEYFVAILEIKTFFFWLLRFFSFLPSYKWSFFLLFLNLEFHSL